MVSTVIIAVSLVVVLSACGTGSTDVTGGPTGPTQTAPTGPTATGPSAGAGATGSGDLEGTWRGTWDTDVPLISVTFSMQITSTTTGFTGAIAIEGSPCVTGGDVEVTLEGDQISFGTVEAEQEIAFEGTVSGDQMSGTYEAGSCPPPNSGTWEATRT
jgi:hypothetical protein